MLSRISRHLSGLLFLLATITFIAPTAHGADTNISPNESHPLKAKAILDSAPDGAYVSVGTERGFMGAALCPGASHLLLLDFDEDVVFFNRINIALIEASKNRKDYLELRLHASAVDWVLRARDSSLHAQSRAILSDSHAFQRWASVIRNKQFELFHDNSGYSSWYKGANYLFVDSLFLKLHQMAKNGRIASIQGDLTKTKDLEQAVEIVKTIGLRFSVIDISNTWWSAYAGRKGIKKVLAAFRSATKPKTLLLLTQYENFFDFGYFAATFDQLDSKPQEEAFLKYLQDFDKDNFLAVHSTYLPTVEAGQVNSHLKHLGPLVAESPELKVTTSWGRFKSFCARLLE